MDKPRRAAREASTRREVARMLAQKADERASGRNFFAIDKLPTAVTRVVGDLRALGGGPSGAVVSKSLFAGLRVSLVGSGRQENASSVAGTETRVLRACVAHREESDRLLTAQWVGAQTALEMSTQVVVISVLTVVRHVRWWLARGGGLRCSRWLDIRCADGQKSCGARGGRYTRFNRRFDGFWRAVADARSHCARDKHVEIRRVSGVCRGSPATADVVGATYVCGVCAVRAGEGGEPAESRL
eukprot:1051795-Pleurochrysis_carterae.AAC.1